MRWERTPLFQKTKHGKFRQRFHRGLGRPEGPAGASWTPSGCGCPGDGLVAVLPRCPRSPGVRWCWGAFGNALRFCRPFSERQTRRVAGAARASGRPAVSVRSCPSVADGGAVYANMSQTASCSPWSRARARPLDRAPRTHVPWGPGAP